MMATKKQRLVNAMLKNAKRTYLYFYSVYKGRRDTGEDEVECWRMMDKAVKVAICPDCHSHNIEDADSRCWRCKTCGQWFLKRGERIERTG